MFRHLESYQPLRQFAQQTVNSPYYIAFETHFLSYHKLFLCCLACILFWSVDLNGMFWLLLFWLFSVGISQTNITTENQSRCISFDLTVKCFDCCTFKCRGLYMVCTMRCKIILKIFFCSTFKKFELQNWTKLPLDIHESFS